MNTILYLSGVLVGLGLLSVVLPPVLRTYLKYRGTRPRHRLQ